ncbi:hypothetical protein ACFPRL_17570 [Pseudoclavibacter helvolus]
MLCCPSESGCLQSQQPGSCGSYSGRAPTNWIADHPGLSLCIRWSSAPNPGASGGRPIASKYCVTETFAGVGARAHHMHYPLNSKERSWRVTEPSRTRGRTKSRSSTSRTPSSS